MWPATPTPLPPGQPFFDAPTGYTSLWNGGTDFALQLWAWMGFWGSLLQLFLLLLVIGAGAFVIVRFFQTFTRKDAES